MLLLKRLLRLFLLPALIISVAYGCKSDSPTEPKNDLVGTWKLTKIYANISGLNVVMTPEQAKETFGIQISVTIVAKSDATYEATVVRDGVSTIDKGTWSTSGNQFTLKSSDGTSVSREYSLNGNILTIKRWEIEVATIGKVIADFEMTKQ